jgi:hypothetical protein
MARRAPRVPANPENAGAKDGGLAGCFRRTFEQRHAEMTFLIHPILMERYQAFYQTEAPVLRCTTCHGEDAERERYQIARPPLDDLKPALVRKLYLPGAALSEEQRFKRDEITPLMARLMGVPAYDAATGLGFSCFGCHPRESD